MTVIHTTIKTIDQRVKRLVRLRRITLLLAWLCLAAAAVNLLEAKDWLNYSAAGLAASSGLVCQWSAHRIRVSLREIERNRRFIMRYVSNGR